MRVFRLPVVAGCLLHLARLEAAPPVVPPDLLPLSLEGRKQMDGGNISAAEKTFRSLVEQAPDNLYLHSNLGVIYFRERKYELSRREFIRALEIVPDDEFAHCTLGILYYSQGKYDAAIEQLTAALRSNPRDMTAHNYLGITFSQKGDPVAARQELEAAIDLDAKYADSFYNLAVVLATMVPPDKAGATKYYGRALELGAARDTALDALIDWKGSTPHVPKAAGEGEKAPTEPAPAPVAVADPALTRSPVPAELLPLAREGREQFAQGHYQAAEKVYLRILEEAPDNLYALSNLGVVFFREEKLPQAEDILRKAIATNPRDGFSHCILGIVHYSQANFDEAINELIKAIELNPEDATAHRYLGTTANQLGLREMAEKELSNAAKLEGATPASSVPANPGDFLTPLEMERLAVPPPLR